MKTKNALITLIGTAALVVVAGSTVAADDTGPPQDSSGHLVDSNGSVVNKNGDRINMKGKQVHTPKKSTNSKGQTLDQNGVPIQNGLEARTIQPLKDDTGTK